MDRFREEQVLQVWAGLSFPYLEIQIYRASFIIIHHHSSLPCSVHIRLSVAILFPNYCVLVCTYVLIHLDQHFIERGPYRSERERTLEIMGWGRIVRELISPTWLESINNSPGPCYQPSLLHTGCRVRAGRPGVEQAATFLSLDPENQRGKECLRGSQTICSL